MTSFRDNLRGIVAISIGMLGFLLNDTMIKLTGPGMPLGQMMFIRGLFAGAIIGTALIVSGQHRQLHLLIRFQVAGRLVGEVGVTVMFLTALLHMPIANATTIIQIVPLAVTAAAVVFLGEQVGWRRWLAIFAGFIGVLIIVRPGTAGFNAYALVALASVLFATLRDTTTRAMPLVVPNLLLASATSGIIVVVGAVMGHWEDWVTPDRWQLMRMALAGLFLNIAYYFTIIGLRSGEIAVVSPFRYSIILWATISGFVFWGDIPDLASVLGGLIIIMAGIYTVYRERQVARQRLGG